MPIPSDKLFDVDYLEDLRIILGSCASNLSEMVNIDDESAFDGAFVDTCK